MDLACSVQPANLFRSSQGTSTNNGSPCTSSGRRSSLRFRHRSSRVCVASEGRGVGRTTRRDALRSGYLDSRLVFGYWSVRGSSFLLGSFAGGGWGASRPVSLQCQGNDSLAYVEGGNGRIVEDGDKEGKVGPADGVDASGVGEEEAQAPTLEELRELLQKAMRELEAARFNSTTFEEKAQRISETAIALKDEAMSAQNDVSLALEMVQQIVSEEAVAKEAVQKATFALSLAEARVKVARETLQGGTDSLEGSAQSEDENEALLTAQNDIKECQDNLSCCEAELARLQSRKEELQKEVDRLSGVAEKAQMNSLKAEDEVTNIMVLAEQAVAFELEAAKMVDDAEIALKKAEKSLSTSYVDAADVYPVHISGDQPVEAQIVSEGSVIDIEEERGVSVTGDALVGEPSLDRLPDKPDHTFDEVHQPDNSMDNGNGKVGSKTLKDTDAEVEKSKGGVKVKKQDIRKDSTKDSPLPSNAHKASLKKSSRFFSASFFSFDEDGVEFTPASIFQGLTESIRTHLPKVVFGLVLLGGGVAFYLKRVERSYQMIPQPDIVSINIVEVSSNAKPVIRSIQELPRRMKKLMDMLSHQEVNEEEASLFDMLWLLLASVIFVPIFQKLPGGSPVLGYLAAGILIGPYGLSIIRHVHGTKAIAEFGVVFLLFNIGLELSVERLSSMKKYVFGLGSAQVLATAVAIGLVCHYVCGLPGPAAIVIGNGLALSSTAVVLQVLQERGESTSRHGRATFSVLLFQDRWDGSHRKHECVPIFGSATFGILSYIDLAVVVLLILIPLISPNSLRGGVGVQSILEALGLAAVKAAVAISAIIAGGRLLLRPIYRQIAENQNAEIFSANTLLVILGTSLLTARAGLSMALGAFLAGLLLAETEFSLQVESDIAPYRGLLLGLFFMTVGMSIDPKLLAPNFRIIAGSLGLLIGGKTLLVALVGRVFGVSIISAIRVGLLLAPGGEFAFVAFGEAANQAIISPHLSSLLFLLVGISMAITPWLAAGGQIIASRFEQHDVRSLLPDESETDDLQDHIIICGFGRVGQIIAQLLSERLIPFVALDVRSDRVAIGRAMDLPVYFGDAGSREVLHKVGAERACAAAVTLDSPGANYRTVWALSKNFPNVKTFVRAHDVDHGLNLEKAGATAVVPETLEPSLQLASAVLAQAKLPMSEIAATINEFRSRHLSELTELSETSGSSLGYGFSRIMSKPAKTPQSPDSSDESSIGEGTLAI